MDIKKLIDEEDVFIILMLGLLFVPLIKAALL